jgi:hypothetical protein
MGAPLPEVVLNAPTGNCCQISSAPVPERSMAAPAPVAPFAAAPPHASLNLSRASHPAPVMAIARSAPADLQLILCVFLI